MARKSKTRSKSKSKHQGSSGGSEQHESKQQQQHEEEELSGFEARRQQVAAKIAEVMLDPMVLGELEEHVMVQMKEGEYDFEANRHVLKLYSISPDSIKLDVLANVLTLSLMHMPETHFLASTYLLPQSVIDIEPVKTILRLGTLLETAQFERFWKDYETNSATFSNAKGFEDNVRAFIAGTLSLAYDTAEVQTMLGMLHLKDAAALKAFGAQQRPNAWVVSDDGKTVKLGGNVLKAQRKRNNEHISIEQVGKVISLFS
eukprot:TRINITY_DN60404_c0_g1_i1.p1 TRINITY_DN60404_c0_g1~~TRINITY_DN60404_c0_g1_i1.p1  ORF type:complete len:293 (+),score=160.26 TRINITY_DN60404_c0_g1_i1:104-880(+)